MARKSNTQRVPKNKKHMAATRKATKSAKATARIFKDSQTKGIEPKSGAESSSLDPKRKALPVTDEYRVPAISGQLSGDVQGLSQTDLDDSESVEELVEEGQDLEGELVQGVENAPPADQGDVRTHASPEPQDRTPDYKNRNRL